MWLPREDREAWLMLTGMVIFMVVAFSAVAVVSKHRRAEFMAECLQYHKQYECDIGWGEAAQ